MKNLIEVLLDSSEDIQVYDSSLPYKRVDIQSLYDIQQNHSVIL